MGKSKAGGQKVDLKSLLAPAQPEKKAAGPAWAKGAGAAAAAPPPGKSAGVAIAPPKASGPSAAGGGPLVGSWAKGGPQGLAATATSLNAAARPKQFAPASRVQPAAIPAKRPSCGLKGPGGPPPPVFDAEAFPEAKAPKTSAEKSKEQQRESACADLGKITDAAKALQALCSLAGYTGPSADKEACVQAALGWVLQTGLPEAQSTETRQAVAHAAGLLVDHYGSNAKIAALMREQLEAFFAEQQQKGKNTPQALEANGLVDAVLFGKLAGHLASDDPKRGSIRMRLMKRLVKPTTPPAAQRALAGALEPLLADDEAAIEDAKRIFLEGLAHDQEAVRRGAALGMATTVMAGGGATAMKKLGIMDFVKAALASEGKSAAGRRQGGLFCLEAVAKSLGPKFEPYALTAMPLLLASCSDSAKDVHLAGRAAATAVVSQVSSNGVRLMVNPLLNGLQDKRWRTQLSSIDLLKPMLTSLAEQSPKRLAAVMPKAVPLLCEAAASTRAEVREAARGLLEQIGSMVDHADVKSLAPTLVLALVDATDGPITEALETLTNAVFTSALTAPAYALLFPVLARAMTRGDAVVRQRGASFVRTIVSLSPSLEDVDPYFVTLKPQLQTLLADPAPAVRAAAAEAIGALATVDGGTGEDEDWAKSLMQQLGASKDGAELEGAAEGLASALVAATEERRNELLEELLAPAEPGAQQEGQAPLAVRLAVCTHLPRALAKAAPEDWEPTMGLCLPALERALADPDESVRNAGKRGLAAAVAAVNRDEVARNLVDHLKSAYRQEDLRARLAAGEIALELQPKLKPAWPSSRTLMVVAFIGQSDTVGDVRKTSERVWRAGSTAGEPPAKRLKELRPHVLAAISEDISSGAPFAAAAAGRAAAQLNKKLETAGGVMSDITEMLVEILEAGDPAGRCSACVGLTELVLAEKGQQTSLLEEPQLAAALRGVLFDDDDQEALRAAAACVVAAPPSTFLEPLLEELCGGGGEGPAPAELRGLQEICARCAKGASGMAVLEAIVGCLASAPRSGAKMRCMAALAAAPLVSLSQVVDSVFIACVEAAAAGLTEESKLAAEAVAEKLAASGMAAALDVVLTKLEVGVASKEAEAAAQVLAALLGAAGAAAPPAPLPLQLFEALAPGALLIDGQGCAAACTLALSNLQKLCGAAQLADGLPLVCTTLARGADTILAEAFDAIIPVALAGISGSEQRAAAVEAAGALLHAAPAEAVQAQAVKVAGPLVRSLAEKSADASLLVLVLAALETLLAVAGGSLRPLIPALQTSLIRLLESPSSELADGAIKTLAALAPAAPKAEALVKALCKPPIKCAAVLRALGAVLRALGPSPSSEVIKEARPALEAAAASADAALKSAGAEAAAALPS